MANVVDTDKQVAIISALAEGSSIRSIERMTGVHRDTIMRLGVKVGQGCTALMDEKMRNLSCRRLEMDEIWGFVGKKEKHVNPRPVTVLHIHPALSPFAAVRAFIIQEFRANASANAEA